MYIRTLIAAPVICALVNMLIPEGRSGKYVRLTLGLITAAGLLSPLTGIVGMLFDGGYDYELTVPEEEWEETAARISKETCRLIEEKLEDELERLYGGKFELKLVTEYENGSVAITGATLASELTDAREAAAYVKAALGCECEVGRYE